MALLMALLSTVILMAIGTTLLLLGGGESTLAGHDRESRALSYASHAAAAIAMEDLRGRPDLIAVGSSGTVPEVSAMPGAFLDSTLTPAAPWGGRPLDLRALTTALQADSDAADPSGGPAPTWRLFEYGPLAVLVPEARTRDPFYLVVWVALDDGQVLTRAVAYGSVSGRSITEVTVTRQPDPARLRILTVRPGS